MLNFLEVLDYSMNLDGDYERYSDNGWSHTAWIYQDCIIVETVYSRREEYNTDFTSVDDAYEIYKEIIEELDYQLNFEYDLYIEIKNDKILITLDDQKYISDSTFKNFEELQ